MNKWLVSILAKKLLQYGIGFVLWLIALLLIIPMTVINFFVVWKKYGTPKGYFLNSAVSIDKWANREFRASWNRFLITKESPDRFGNIEETLSSVLGKNQRDNTLTKTGKVLVFILDTLDKDHCNKSINDKL